MSAELSKRDVEPTIVEWVDILSFDAIKEVATLEVRCVLRGGAVVCEGNQNVIAQLEAGIQLGPDAPLLTPLNGRAFLEALGQHFKSPYLFATEVKTGAQITDHVVPPMKSL